LRGYLWEENVNTYLQGRKITAAQDYERPSVEALQLIRKLRWIGMEEEAERVETQLHETTLASGVITAANDKRENSWERCLDLPRFSADSQQSRRCCDEPTASPFPYTMQLWGKHVWSSRTGAGNDERLRSDQRSIHPRASAFSWFFGVPPVTAVAEKTVYVSRREMMDAS
jgi:hypothetical protein